MDIKQRAKQLKNDIPAVFIALKKKETPFLAKLVAAITVGYALSPIDLVPDFIPILGYLDDIIILPMLIVFTVKLIPKDVFRQCQLEAQNIWENGKPKRWIYGIPVILFWIIIIVIMINGITG